MTWYRNLIDATPGAMFCCLVGSVILILADQIQSITVDPILLALFVGIAYKTILPRARWHISGARFSGKYILEFSVMVLGASIFLPDVASSGVKLFGLVVFGVVGGMAIAYVIGHLVLRLSTNLAILIGISNSICGNSAALTLAPIIGANAVELTTVIAVSGILGAIQIIFLPILGNALGLSEYEYGIMAGMAVYAVAQVYAASITVSPTSASVATFIKLLRVLLLGPAVVCTQLCLTIKRSHTSREPGNRPFRGIRIHQYVPWFVAGFILLSIIRSLEIISGTQGDYIRAICAYPFAVAMVAIGTEVDVRDILKVGPKVGIVIGAVLVFLLGTSILGGAYLPPP